MHYKRTFLVYEHDISRKYQPTTVWLSTLGLNLGSACWCHCEMSPRWAHQVKLDSWR